MAENLLSRGGISEQEIFTHPYVVHKELQGNFGVSLSGYDAEFEDSLNSLKGMMLTVAKLEAQKERLFIETFIQRNFINYDSNFANSLRAIYYSNNPNKLSQVLDAIQKYRMKMYDSTKSIKENAVMFASNWESVYNKTFVNAVKNLNLRGRDPGDMTIEELIDMVQQNIIEKYKETTSPTYATFVKKVMDNIRTMSKDKFGQDYQVALKKLEDNAYIQVKRKEHASKGRKKSDTPLSIVQGYLFGVINGLSAEAYLEANKTGTSTARITQTLKTTTGKGAGAKVAIQTDVLEVLSYDFEAIPPDQSEIINQTIKTADEMYAWLNSLDLEKHFVLHTSVKDQSTNKNYAAGALSIDVRKEASLDARLQPLKEICEKINLGDKSLENLIFALVNAGTNMISEDLYKNGKLLQGLVAVCAAYMFEDYIDTFTQLTSETTNSALHVYFINGNYYTLSDILIMASSTIDKKKSASFVQIGFKPTNKDEFAQENLVGLEGRERWDKVRENTLAHGKMNIRLNTRLLIDTVYQNL